MVFGVKLPLAYRVDNALSNHKRSVPHNFLSVAGTEYLRTRKKIKR